MPRLFLEVVRLLALVSVDHSDSPPASETAANSALITTSHADNYLLKARILPARSAPATSQYNPLWARGRRAWID
jgi:hypothetical protein